MIAVEPKDVLAAWAADRIGVEAFVPPYSVMADVDARGKIRAVFVFNMRTAHDVEVSVAADVMTRRFLREAFVYVTSQLGCRRATFRTRADNAAAQAALRRLGARLEGRQRAYFGDVDGLLYGILAEDYRHGV